MDGASQGITAAHGNGAGSFVLGLIGSPFSECPKWAHERDWLTDQIPGTRMQAKQAIVGFGSGLSIYHCETQISLSFQVRRSSTSLNVRAGPIALCLLLIEDSAATGIGWISFFFIWSFQIGNNDHNKIGVEKKTDCSRAEHVYILHNKEMTPVAKRISELNKA